MTHGFQRIFSLGALLLTTFHTETRHRLQ